MNIERYQYGLDRIIESVSGSPSNTLDHVKLVESYETLDADPSDYVVSFALGDIYSKASLTQ